LGKYFFISKRFLFSNQDSRFISFITYISIIGVILGVASLVIAVSVLNGFEKEIQDKVSGLVSHIQVTSYKPEGIENYNKSITDIKALIHGISGISPYIQREAVIRYKGTVEGIVLKGINQNTDISSARNKIITGTFDLNKTDSLSKVIIGDKLAKNLNIKAGDNVFIFGLNGIPSPLNPPKIKKFIVSGTYETGLRDYDDIIIYTDLNSAQDIFSMGSYTSGIEIKLIDASKAEEAAMIIRKELGYPYNAKSMFKLFKGLFTWVELQKAPTPIILGLIIIVATFNIVGALLMLVLEKTSSIGVLKSLGASKLMILKVFLLDGLIISIIGIIFGNIIGIGICILEQKYQFFSLPEIYYMKNVPILLEYNKVLFISVVTFLLSIAATLFPAFFASRIDPVKSIKFS
jgi:lipoprotein-releasing system permease protein